jgi:hypothetical protein
MDSAFAALGGRPTEMFYGIGHVDIFAIDSGLLQALIENVASRSDEGVAGNVLFVTRLFAYQHDGRTSIAFSEHRLRGIFPQIAASAPSRSVLKAFEGRVLRNEGGCVSLFPGL